MLESIVNGVNLRIMILSTNRMHLSPGGQDIFIILKGTGSCQQKTSMSYLSLLWSVSFEINETWKGKMSHGHACKHSVVRDAFIPLVEIFIIKKQNLPI